MLGLMQNYVQISYFQMRQVDEVDRLSDEIWRGFEENREYMSHSREHVPRVKEFVFRVVLATIGRRQLKREDQARGTSTIMGIVTHLEGSKWFSEILSPCHEKLVLFGRNMAALIVYDPADASSGF